MAMPEESVVHGSTARPQDLPSVDQLLRLAVPGALLAEHGHTLVVKRRVRCSTACARKPSWANSLLQRCSLMHWATHSLRAYSRASRRA